MGATIIVVLMICGGVLYAQASTYGLSGRLGSSSPHSAYAGGSGGLGQVTGLDKNKSDTHTNTHSQTQTHGSGNETETTESNENSTEVTSTHHSSETSQNESNSSSATETWTGSQGSEGNETSHTYTHTSENESSSTSASTTETSFSETETSSEVVNSSSGGNETQNELKYRMVSALSQLPMPGYQVGQGEANIHADGAQLSVHVQLERMNPSTTFELALVVNGTAFSLGNFTTSHEGNAEIQASYSLPKGGYAIGLAVYDTETLHTELLVLAGQPATLPLAILQSQSGSTSTTSTTHGHEGEGVTVYSGGPQQEDDIQKAINNKTIPAVIQVGSSGISYTVIDPNFTLFVGKLQGGGIQITISSAGASHPRVLLVNLNSSQYLDLQSGSLAVSFDGAPVSQASSVSSVLSPRPTGSPQFVLVSTASGYQLLISIPHFSTHFIEIIPALAGLVRSLLAVDAPALLLSLAVVTVVVLTVYSRRLRIMQ
jgi:hypothetical protein